MEFFIQNYSANEWPGFYMIEVMKESLMENFIFGAKY